MEISFNELIANELANINNTRVDFIARWLRQGDAVVLHWRSLKEIDTTLSKVHETPSILEVRAMIAERLALYTPFTLHVQQSLASLNSVLQLWDDPDYEWKHKAHEGSCLSVYEWKIKLNKQRLLADHAVQSVLYLDSRENINNLLSELEKMSLVLETHEQLCGATPEVSSSAAEMRENFNKDRARTEAMVLFKGNF